MKAISIQPQWAHLIALGWKNIECRTWQTKAPCDILMVTSKKSYPYFPGGYAVAVLHIEAISEMHEGLLENAFMEEMPAKKSYAWHITSYCPCKPFPVKGKLHLYDVPQEFDDLETIPDGATYEEISTTIFNWLKPLIKEMPDTLEEALQREEFADLFG
jgi:hypothetical protein